MSMRLETRDLINVGVFTVIYFVVLFITGMLGIFSPVVMFVGFALGLLLNGPVVALYLARTPKMGALTLLSLIVGLLLFLTGHPWITPVISTLAGLAGDAAFARVRGSWRMPVAYAFLSLLYLAPLMPVLYNSADYFDYIAEDMGREYADSMASFLQPWTIPLWGVVVFALALIGGRVGVMVGRRSFTRAGLA